MKRNLPILFALLLTASLAGCSKDDLQNSPDDGSTDTPVGETVEVALNLDVLAPNQPEQGAKSQRNATFAQAKSPATERIIASEHTGSMLMELVETPQEPTTRAVDENTIANFWVFQYNGITSTAKLVKKQYFESYTAGVAMNLVAGTNQTVVIIANSFDRMLGGSTSSNFIVGTSTYQSLLDASRTITTEADLLTNSGGNLPMSGTATGTLQSGTVLNVSLRRDVAQISVQLRNGSLQDRFMIVQLCDVPKNSYYMPHRDAVFPAAGLATISYPEDTIHGFNTTSFVTAGTWYVPCNHRGTVSGTTSIKRWTNKPVGATYLSIWGEDISVGDLLLTNTYHIPLGADFITDYNLLPNYQYTYRITLYDYDESDSQAALANGEYVGMFGGELKDIGGGVWQYTKPLYAENKSSDLSYGMKVNAPGLFPMDEYENNGRTPTWYYGNAQDLTTDVAFQACVRHPGNSLITRSENDLVWYLPGVQQLYISLLLGSGSGSESEKYTAATAPFDGTNAYSISVWRGTTGTNAFFNSSLTSISSYKVRCVREF